MWVIVEMVMTRNKKKLVTNIVASTHLIKFRDYEIYREQELGQCMYQESLSLGRNSLHCIGSIICFPVGNGG